MVFAKYMPSTRYLLKKVLQKKEFERNNPLKKAVHYTRPVFISSSLPNNLQISQLICVLIGPQLQLAGYLVEKISREILVLFPKYPAI